MVTLRDIIDIMLHDKYCVYHGKFVNCRECSKNKCCPVDTKTIAYEYLNRGEYYG